MLLNIRIMAGGVYSTHERQGEEETSGSLAQFLQPAKRKKSGSRSGSEANYLKGNLGKDIRGQTKWWGSDLRKETATPAT
jgi:hypothetical protein